MPYSLTYSLTHLLTHILTHLLTYSLPLLLTHSLTYSLTHSLSYSLTHSLTHLGWGGDTGPIMYNTMKALEMNTPMELAPVKLGKRSMPPHYENYHGWQYTFGYCNHTRY